MRIIAVANPWFDHICSGRKTVEGRKASPGWTTVVTGDVVRFVGADGPPVDARVTGVKKYADVRTYLSAETLERTLPGVQTIEEGEAVYARFWTADEVAQHGVLAIAFELINSEK